MVTMHDDIRTALRSLRSSPTFTVVALTVLALGIGASTAIFSVVDAVILRGLPFDEHDRLAAVGERRVRSPTADPARDPDALSSIAPQNYLDWVAQQQVFETIAAVGGGALTLREPGAEPEDLRAHRVTAGYFDVLRVRPAIGRTFTADHEVDGNHRAVILSDALWRRRFGGDPAVIGRTIPLEGASYEILGVLPADFPNLSGGVRPIDAWVPYVVPPNERIRNPRSRSHYLQAVARLKPGVTMQQAQAQMDQVALALEQTHPEWNKDSRIGVRPLRDHIVGAPMKSWMLMLLGAVAIVLLIACANVANLLLARATTREREIGIRAALGAGRWRLMRQLMVESLVLSVSGTVLAVVLARWAVGLLVWSMPEGVPRVMSISLDLRVLAAAAGLSVLTGMLFGIFPALQLSRPDLTTALKDGTRAAGTGVGRQRVRSILVVAEVALAVVLLVAAALFIGSFVALMRIHPGFDPDRVLTAQVFPRNEPGGPPADAALQFSQILERVAQIPGVVHGSVISGGMPFSGSMSITSMTVPGKSVETGKDDGVSIRRVSAGYHRALRIPLLAGRLFEPTDRQGSANVVIINESAAKKYFAGEDPVGRTANINNADRTIVGVVGDVHQTSLETEPRTEAYVPIEQLITPGGELVIRTSGNPYDVLPAVRSAVLAVMPDVPLRNIRTMEELFATRIAQRRFNMLLLGLFGVLGLVIAAVGIYGVMAYLVAQRTREIGVRIALGASRSSVIAMVLTRAAVLVGVGLVIGGVATWYLSSIATSFLFRIDAGDPRAFGGAMLTLLLAALVASAIPARRAASVDPMVALRAE